MHGRSNVGFLFMEAAVACVAMIWMFQRPQRQPCQQTRQGLSRAGSVRLFRPSSRAVRGEATRGAPASAAFGGSALLMVGLFGFAILKGTPDAALAKAFAQSSGSGGDGGGSCGGGGGGGGGCGGCGGGGGD